MHDDVAMRRGRRADPPGHRHAAPCDGSPACEARYGKKQKAGESAFAGLLRCSGAPGEIRTPDHQVRSLVLYPAELRARSWKIMTSAFGFVKHFPGFPACRDACLRMRPPAAAARRRSARPLRKRTTFAFGCRAKARFARIGMDATRRNWRRLRDSNPRWSFWPHTPLAGEPLRPLGQVSAELLATRAHRIMARVADGKRFPLRQPAALFLLEPSPGPSPRWMR